MSTRQDREPGAEVVPYEAAPLDVSYETELDDRPGPGPPVPVDPVHMAELQPVIPHHLHTLRGIRSATARSAGRQWHRARYHGIRSPWYLLLAVCWAVAGMFRLAGRQIRWWWVIEQHTLRSQAAAAGDSGEWMRLHREAKATRKMRGIVLVFEVAAVVIGAVLLATVAPWWARVVAAVAVLPILAHLGRPGDRPVISPAVVTPRFRKLSADVVLRAYHAAGLGHPDKPGQQITFGAPMSRDGDGSRVLVDLPYGLGLDDAVKARPKIASGLDVQVSQVFLRRDPTSHRRHVLWVADRDPLAVPVGRTPLLACRPADIWQPAPLGLDERGQLVAVDLMWHSVLVGGMPRQGKSWTSRLLALTAALDPYVQIDVFDASGKPDWRRFAQVAGSCAFGLTPTRDGKPPELLLATLMRLKADVEERYARLSAMPTSVCPEGKLTRDIARDPRYRMPVRLLVLGEVQEYFLLGDISRTLAELLVYLVKVAPGAGVIVLSDTQRPSGIGTGAIQTQFVNFRDQHQVRFALRTPSWQVSDLVLGDGAYSAGLDSSALLPDYKGVGILRGASDASPVTRCYYCDDQDAERIVTAARALRERAGTVTGVAAGAGHDHAATDVLADVLTVFGAESGLHWQVLAVRLARQFPDRWADAAADSVSAQCRALGVPSVDVRYPPGRQGANRKGCRRADVEGAARQ